MSHTYNSLDIIAPRETYLSQGLERFPMEPSESTKSEVPIRVNDDIRLVIEAGTDAICYTNVYYRGEHIGRLNNPISKPWKDLSLKMASLIILKKSDTYDSREELDEMQYEAMLEHKAELDEVFGWEE